MPEASEDDIRRIGRELFAGVRRRRPRPGSRAWLDDLGMAWSMRDEQLKVPLFRFVDALPGLRTPQAVASHLSEYLVPVADRLPFPSAAVLARLPRSPLLARAAAGLATLGVRQLARKFIAGEDLPRITAQVERLRREHLASTVDLLGEAVISSQEADGYRDAYLGLIAALARAATAWPEDAQIDRDQHGRLPAVNISLKVSALVHRFDPADPVGSIAGVRTRLLPILRAARAHGVFVNIDMEQNAYRALTLDLVTQLLAEPEFRAWSDVGIAIQAYLLCAGADLQHLLGWARSRGTPLWIRLVKGAYHDHERVVAAQQGWAVPVFTAKAATDANYEVLSGFLLDHHELLRPAFASHNVRTLAYVLAGARARGLPRGAIEFQMLYGMADALKATLVGRGERVRVYAPYGRLLPGMAYLVRRLLENTSNQSFVRVGLLEHGDEEELLMRPQAADQPAAPRRSAFANQPFLDFSRADASAACAQAVATLAARLPLRVPAVLGAATIAADARTTSRDPGQRTRVVAEVATTTAVDARAAVASAKAAWPAWRGTPVPERAALLLRLAEELLRRRHELIALIVLEAGKGAPEADAEVCEAIDFCRYYAAEMLRLATGQHADLPGETNRTSYDARGVVVVIAPWNFPLAILAGMAVAALVAGNTVVLKPAEQTPAIAGALLQALQSAGCPAGVANLLPGVGEVVGPVLVGHDDVALIAFTGSVAVGLGINEQAARWRGDEVKRVVCEMGGKNAIIVDADADLDEAVLGVMHSAFGYQGQKCSACSRAIVIGDQYAPFLERLVQATASLALGPAWDPASAVGPVIDDEARERILARIAAVGATARLAYAGTVPVQLAAAGSYVAPHIFSEVDPASPLAQEEIFGPVLAVLAARDLDHALEIANGTRFALTGGCYSRSPATIARVTRDFRVGNLYINRRITGALVGIQPFGGFKLSGIGSKAGGPDYLLQFLVPRTVSENTMRHGFTPDL